MEPRGMVGARLAEVLLVEDDPADALLIRRAMERSKLALNLAWVEDGEQALEYLRGEGDREGAVLPDLVLLDLNMPKKGGMAVLAEIRQDPALTHLPVVILTTSQADEDVFRSYRLHANAYITKPMELDGIQQMLYSLDRFWFSVVVLPQGDQVQWR